MPEPTWSPADLAAINDVRDEIYVRLLAELHADEDDY